MASVSGGEGIMSSLSLLSSDLGSSLLGEHGSSAVGVDTLGGRGDERGSRGAGSRDSGGHGGFEQVLNLSEGSGGSGVVESDREGREGSLHFHEDGTHGGLLVRSRNNARASLEDLLHALAAEGGLGDPVGSGAASIDFRREGSRSRDEATIDIDISLRAAHVTALRHSIGTTREEETHELIDDDLATSTGPTEVTDTLVRVDEGLTRGSRKLLGSVLHALTTTRALVGAARGNVVDDSVLLGSGIRHGDAGRKLKLGLNDLRSDISRVDSSSLQERVLGFLLLRLHLGQDLADHVAHGSSVTLTMLDGESLQHRGTKGLLNAAFTAKDALIELVLVTKESVQTALGEGTTEGGLSKLIEGDEGHDSAAVLGVGLGRSDLLHDGGATTHVSEDLVDPGVVNDLALEAVDGGGKKSATLAADATKTGSHTNRLEPGVELGLSDVGTTKTSLNVGIEVSVVTISRSSDQAVDTLESIELLTDDVLDEGAVSVEEEAVEDALKGRISELAAEVREEVGGGSNSSATSSTSATPWGTKAVLAQAPRASTMAPCCSCNT